MIPVLYSEVNILCIMILLLIYTKVKPETYTQYRQILFRGVLISNSIFFALDALWIFINTSGFGAGITVNWVLNILYYITSGIVGFLWFMYSESVQQSNLVKGRKHIFLCAVPILILSVLTFASVKTGWLFYIDDANVYHRGPLYALQLLFSYGYVMFSAGKALILSKKKAGYTQKVQYRTLAYFVIAPLIAGVIQVLVPGISILCVGTTFGALYVFVTMQEQMIFTDALTGLNNRNRLMKHLSDRMTQADSRENLYVVMMDLDHFKSINDGFGHVEGDNALCMTADALKTCCVDHHFFIARYGGDEFAAVCELEEEDQIEKFCSSIRASIKKKNDSCPYTLSLSLGYAKYNFDIVTAQEFVKRADAKLYHAKQKLREG